MIHTISPTALRARAARQRLGLLLSLLLALVIVNGHHHYPQTYNDLLLWSVVAFVALANLIGYFRYRRYMRLARDHQIELRDQQLHFLTGGERSTLEIDDILLLTLYRSGHRLRHIELKLRSGRGIRLEDYTDLEQLGAVLAERLPEEQVIGHR